MTSFQAEVARASIGLSVLCLALSVDQSPLCRQTNQIKGMMAVQWSPLVTGYLVEFDRLLVHFDHKGNQLKHAMNETYPFELCGIFALQCPQVGASCQGGQALILFHKAKRQFHFQLISDWSHLTSVIGEQPSATTTAATTDKRPPTLVKTLNKLQLQQRAPMTFHRVTSEFYIVDNGRHIILRLNINNGRTDKLRTLTDPFSSIFTIENRVHAVLWKMDTLFEWKQEVFRPTVRSVKHLLNCQRESILETRKLASILSQCCIAILIVLVFLLTLTFINIQKMYSYNFNISRINSIK